MLRLISYSGMATSSPTFPAANMSANTPSTLPAFTSGGSGSALGGGGGGGGVAPFPGGVTAQQHMAIVRADNQKSRDDFMWLMKVAIGVASFFVVLGMAVLGFRGIYVVRCLM